MRTYTLLFVLLVFSVRADDLILHPDGVVRPGAPTRIEADNIVYTVPDCQRTQFGYAVPSQTQIDSYTAAQAAAQAEAEAQASLPETFPNGIAVRDDNGHWVELVPSGDTLPVLGYQVSNSPLSKNEHDAMKTARKADTAALKASAYKAKNEKDQAPLLMKAVFGVGEYESKD